MSLARLLADYSCQDEAGGSGLASCVGTVADGTPIDTATVGPKPFTVNAEDNVGNTASLTNDYSVVYDFSGFFSPVDNPPVLNSVKAGRGIPGKFSLAGDRGLDIFATGHPKSEQTNCSPTAAVDGDRVDRDGRLEQPLLRRRHRPVHLRLEDAEGLDGHVPPARREAERRHQPPGELHLQVGSGEGLAEARC